MPNGAKTLLVILLIPFLAGIGHDIYLNYFSSDEKIREVKSLRINPEKFLVSDLGWVWNKYSQNTMEATRGAFSPQTWTSKIDPVLQLPTMIVGLIPWVIALVYLFLARLIGFWPCANNRISFNRRRKKDDYAVYKHTKTKAVKYKHK